MKLLRWFYEQTLRWSTVFFTVVWIAIGVALHDVGFIGAFIYMPILYLASAIDSYKRTIEDEQDEEQT